MSRSLLVRSIVFSRSLVRGEWQKYDIDLHDEEGDFEIEITDDVRAGGLMDLTLSDMTARKSHRERAARKRFA